MTTYVQLAAPGDALGSIGAGGAALAVTALIVLGTRDKATHKLSVAASMVWGFIAGTLYAGAGGPWASVADLVSFTVRGIGTGSSSGPLGTVGAGAIALVVAISMWLWVSKPRTGALMGLIAATVWAGAGGIWAVPSEIVSGAATAWGI